MYICVFICAIIFITNPNFLPSSLQPQQQTPAPALLTPTSVAMMDGDLCVICIFQYVVRAASELARRVTICQLQAQAREQSDQPAPRNTDAYITVLI